MLIAGECAEQRGGCDWGSLSLRIGGECAIVGFLGFVTLNKLNYRERGSRIPFFLPYSHVIMVGAFTSKTNESSFSRPCVNIGVKNYTPFIQERREYHSGKNGCQISLFYGIVCIFMYFRSKNTKIQVDRDATCIRCRNSFKFCIYDQHGHAHLLAKFCVISCMVKN